MLLGAIAATLSFLCLAGMSALAKEAARYSAVEVAEPFQNLICFACVAPIALRGGWLSLRRQRIGMHLFRAATGTGAWYCLILAITLMPLTNAVLLTYSAPLAMP